MGQITGDGVAPEAPEASGVAFPGVAPAAGLLVQEETVEVHAPEGWRASPEVSDFSSGARAGCVRTVAKCVPARRPG